MLLLVLILFLSPYSFAETPREVECYEVSPKTTFGANLLAVADYKYTRAFQFQRFQPAKNLRIGEPFDPRKKTDFFINLSAGYFQMQKDTYKLKRTATRACEYGDLGL